MSTRAVVIFAALVVAGLGAVATRSCAQEVQLSSRDRALINAASMELVQVTLATRYVHTASLDLSSGALAAADKRITLRVPAAYVGGVDFRQDAGVNRGVGAASVTFWVWSRSFDPVRPDQVADAAACFPGIQRPCAPLGTDGGRMAGRRFGGEYVIEARLENIAGTEPHRRRVILIDAGVNPRFRGEAPSPCEFHEDPALEMLVGRAPQGPYIVDACNIQTARTVETRTGRSFGRATFLMREPDGSPRFAVRCHRFTAPADGVGGSPCIMLGFHGPWQLVIRVPSDRAEEWNGAFLWMRDFLERHTVSRTD